MSSDHPRCSPILLRSPIVHFIQHTISKRRETTCNRFKKPSAWLRLVALGIILINLALLSLTKSVFGVNFGGYWPGMESIFAGVLLVIITTKLARPVIYFDWILLAALEIAVGILLEKQTTTPSFPLFALLALVFACLAITKCWIGITLESGKASASMIAGGVAGLFCAACLVLDHCLFLAIGPETIVATDLVITGFSIIGLGFALRPPPMAVSR